jgi:hypothetical protein
VVLLIVVIGLLSVTAEWVSRPTLFTRGGVLIICVL